MNVVRIRDWNRLCFAKLGAVTFVRKHFLLWLVFLCIGWWENLISNAVRTTIIKVKIIRTKVARKKLLEQKLLEQNMLEQKLLEQKLLEQKLSKFS